MRVIIFRHAKTGPDKFDPERSITWIGRVQTLWSACKLLLVGIHGATLVCAPTRRTLQTARILRCILCTKKICVESELRPVASIRYIQSIDEDLSDTYIRMSQDRTLPTGLENAAQVEMRVCRLLQRLGRNKEPIILVTTASISDTFLELQSAKVTRLAYSEYFMLEL